MVTSVHSTRVVFIPSKDRIRVEIPILNVTEVECYRLNEPPNQLRPSGLEPESYPWKG